jgi:hypothetical protein
VGIVELGYNFEMGVLCHDEFDFSENNF